jgi:hypothetical protein
MLLIVTKFKKDYHMNCMGCYKLKKINEERFFSNRSETTHFFSENLDQNFAYTLYTRKIDFFVIKIGW